MKKTLLILISVCGLYTNAQVGINTTEPKATLDITGSATNLTKIDGVIPPRLTGDELKAKDALYGLSQDGVMVYVTAAANPVSVKTVNVLEKGLYYYNHTLGVWLKFIDTDTYVKPTGLENLRYGSGYAWRYIDMVPTNYGTAGEYSTDLQYIPVDFDELIYGLPITYNDALAIARATNPTILTTTPFGASGPYSFAAGFLNGSSGYASMALGVINESTSQGSIAMGSNNMALNEQAVALGDSNISSGAGSIAMGGACHAEGDNSIAFGGESDALMPGAVAIGRANKAEGETSVAIGRGSTASGLSSLVIGGESQSSGQDAIAIGTVVKAEGDQSVSIGVQNTAVGDQSISIGIGASSQGLGSIAFGDQNTAVGDYSISIGSNSQAEGRVSYTFGYHSISESSYELALGLYNTSDANPEPIEYNDYNKRLLVVGSGSDDADRHDAFTLLRNGRVGIDIDNFELLSENSTNPSDKLYVNGNTKTQGLYSNIREVTTGGIEDNDYTVILAKNVTLPDPTTNKGRILVMCGDSSPRTIFGSIQDSSGVLTSFVTSTTNGGRCINVQSTGTVWWITGRN